MAPNPTGEQVDIIKEESHCVAIAGPGSGKTGTLALKIARILEGLPDYRGVIAISYTNKASHELERRCLSAGVDRKSSFFGTIDKFYLAEIVIPFGRHIFGEPEQEIEVISAEEHVEDGDVAHLVETAVGPIDEGTVPDMARLYAKGKVVLQAIPYLAVHVFDHSLACRRYLKARYSHIITDEYQDCGLWQHTLFLKLVELGVIGVAVGDINQSIFAFAGKDPTFLTNLAQDERFVTYPLSINHRCHPSIVNYSTRLLAPTYQVTPCDSVTVFEKFVDGSEIEIATWLEGAIPAFAECFQISARSKIGILTKNKRTGELIHSNLGVRHRYAGTGPLDEDSSLWGAAFRKILRWAFSPELTKYELVEEYLALDSQPRTVRRVMQVLTEIEDCANDNPFNLSKRLGLFTAAARLILPTSPNQQAVNHLSQTLSSPTHIESYVPARDNEVQLMTLHKAKGLEFDLVFHLDLYQWILPQYRGNYNQDLNLHYVGITRARKACVLCRSSYRHRNDVDAVPAEQSPFLDLNGLSGLRIESPY